MTVNLEYHWVQNPVYTDISVRWKTLKNLADDGMFLSYDWITQWIGTYGEPGWMLEVTHEDNLVAVALFNEAQHKRALGFNVKTLHLHMLGNERYDQIWPEYNGLLCVPLFKPEVYSNLVDEVFKFHTDIDEFDPGLMLHTDFDQLKCDAFLVENFIETVSFQANIIETNSTIFSSNLRSQLNRTLKILQASGNINVVFEFNRQNIAHKFEKMRDLHVLQWQNESGFLNSDFLNFHKNLIQFSNFGLKPMIAELNLDGKVLASHIYYIYGNRINFYLGVTDKSRDNRVKSGLYLHAETMKNMHKWGCSVYDFLAGDYSYKKRMSTVEERLIRVRIKRNTFQYRVELILKNLKSKLTTLFKYA